VVTQAIRPRCRRTYLLTARTHRKTDRKRQASVKSHEIYTPLIAAGRPDARRKYGQLWEVAPPDRTEPSTQNRIAVVTPCQKVRCGALKEG